MIGNSKQGNWVTSWSRNKVLIEIHCFVQLMNILFTRNFKFSNDATFTTPVNYNVME